MVTLDSFNLKENPFDIFSHRHKMANRKEEWKKIIGALSSAFKERYPRIFVLQGDYGSGKTYMLEQIYSWVSEDEVWKKQVLTISFSGANVLFGPRLSIMETEPRWQKFGLSLVTRIFDNIGREKLVSVLKKVSAQSLKELKFQRVFQGIKNDEDEAFSYIAGQKISAKDLKKLGVSSALSDSPTGLRFFFDFLKVIRIAKYESFLVLLDEFEYIPSILGDKKITQILNTFREIYDTFGMCLDREPGKYAAPLFVFAISPGGWNSLEKLEKDALKKTGGGGVAPFMERISKRDFIELKPFSLDNSIELVSLRLSEARIKLSSDPLFPFTKDCVEYVHKMSLNKPRNLIQYCKIILEESYEKGLLEIDGKAAQSILSKYGISMP